MSEYGAPPPPPYGSVPPNQPLPGAGPQYASMGRRLGARLIDLLLIGVVAVILSALFLGGAASQVEIDPVTGEITEGRGALVAAYAGYIALLFAVGFFYEVVLIALRGATLGKQMLGVYVVREADGGLPGWTPSLLRWLIPFVGELVCCVGQTIVYISPFFDNTKRNQGWHDKVAKTFVITR